MGKVLRLPCVGVDGVTLGALAVFQSAGRRISRVPLLARFAKRRDFPIL
jgi:hypothetical protein